MVFCRTSVRIGKVWGLDTTDLSRSLVPCCNFAVESAFVKLLSCFDLELMSGYKTLLCDIEGTVTSISFVKDQLFPYAHRKVADFLNKNLDRGDVREIIHQLVETAAEESKKDNNITFVRPDQLVEDISKHVRYWIDNDKKLTALKNLQGLMWEEAYKAGEIKGHVYHDVSPYWKQIAEEGKKIYIYSSGSVKAQQLLFQYSVDGDLTKYLSGYYDTTTGHKQESESYKKIAASIGGRPSDILFLTDIEGEARAAHEAGMQVSLLARPDNSAKLSEAAEKDFNVIPDLNYI